VFPEDVERVLNRVAGVRDSAAVGVATGGEERVQAVLVVDPGVDPDAVARDANALLADHQKIRRAMIWPEPELPRTEGTRKLRRVDRASAGALPPAEPVAFPSWNRSWPARAIRRVSLPAWILPLARVFAWIRVEGRQHLEAIDSPVIFAANHQSHMDAPVILAALPGRLRYRVAPAMAKEFFRAHFFPEEHKRRAWFTNSLNYWLASLFFNAFPLPQREAGARQ